MQEFVRPRNEVLPVGRIGMPAVVLAPGKLAVQKPAVYRGHFRRVIVGTDAEIFSAEKAENRLRGHRSHKTALLIEPSRVAFFRHPITHKRKAGCTKGQKFMRIDRKVAGSLASEGGFRSAILH